MIMNENHLDERSLGDVRAYDPDEVSMAEVSDETNLPEGFDVDDWIKGVRPTQRAVKLHASGHLIARMEQVVATIEALPADADADDLIDEYETLKTEFNDGVWFVVEKRSKDWIDHFRRETGKRLGIKNADKDLERWSKDDQTKVLMHQVAEQTVSPQVTARDLWALLAANEGELSKLIGTVRQVNEFVAESALVLNRDFSQRRSGSTQPS